MANNLTSRLIAYPWAFVSLIPLLAGLALTALPDFNPLGRGLTERAVLGYGVMLLGFLAGVRAGVCLISEKCAPLDRVLGLALPVLAFSVLLLPYEPGLALLIVGFGGQGAWDTLAAFQKKLPQAYAEKRQKLTLLICFLLMLLWVAHEVFPIGGLQ